MEIKILDPRLRRWGFPKWGTPQSAAMDIFACLDSPIELLPQEVRRVKTGFALNMGDRRLCAIMIPRSGSGTAGLVLANTAGLIDPDYHGEVLAAILNRSSIGIFLSPGDRIAQMLFTPFIRPAFDEVENFSSETQRGAGGFGSTGR